MDRRKVLTSILKPRIHELRRHLRAHTALPGVVENRHVRKVANVPARLPDPIAEVSLLRVDEEPLIEKASAVERLAAREHERAEDPVARRLTLVNRPVQFSLT